VRDTFLSLYFANKVLAMSRFPRWLAGVWLSLLGMTVGCSIPVSEHPTVKPTEAQAFPELYGTYRYPPPREGTELSEEEASAEVGEQCSETPSYTHIGAAGTDFPPGFVRVVVVEQQPGGLLHNVFIGFFDKVADDYLFHLPIPIEESPDESTRPLHQDQFWPDGWDETRGEAYFIVRYRFDDGRGFGGNFMNAEFLATEIEAGRLAGEVKRSDDAEEPKLEGVKITAETPELRAFVEKHIEGELFEPLDEKKFAIRIE